MYGRKVMRTLMRHIDNNTLPVHMNEGGQYFNFLFQERVLPTLRLFFNNEALPLSGARPTQYTRDIVTKSIIERDVADVIELDPGLTKRGLYKKYGFL